MSFDQFAFLSNFRQASGVNNLANRILQNEVMSDQEKIKQLLAIDFLKWGVGTQGNFKLIEFLCKKDNLQTLL